MSLNVEDIMLKLRASLKRRGAEGIRGLARHFKVRAAPTRNVGRGRLAC